MTQADAAARQTAKPVKPGNFTGAAETYLLSRLAEQPDLLYLINRKLKEQNLERVNSEEFTASEDKLLFSTIEDALDQTDEDPIDFVRGKVTPGVVERLNELQSENRDEKLDQDTLVGDLTRRVLDIRLHRLNDFLTQMRYMLEDAQKNGDMRDLLNQEQILQLSKAKDMLTKALGNLTKEN
jgi:hypothetical protein